jgi:prophage regulatory protein
MNKQNFLEIERPPEVLARTGLKRSTLYALIKQGDFPKPIKLSARAIGFLSSEVDDWIAARAAKRAAAA